MDQTYRRRYLAERSNLLFEYPLPSAQTIFTYLPLLENMDISESKKANYATYDLISRSNSLYAYLGAKSRTVTLRFNITLPNVIEYLSKEGLSNYFRGNFNLFYLDQDTQRKIFLNNQGEPNLTTPTPTTQYSQYFIHKAYFEKLIGRSTNSNVDSGLFNSIINAFAPNTNQDRANASDKRLKECIDLILLWVNMVRTSTSNNALNPTMGPPIIRINHGTMYNNVPFVCTSHNIRIINNAGFELNSLTPRQIEITMSLDEVRHGDFTEFTPFGVNDPKGDNHAGWEAVIGYGTTDPYNGGEYAV